MHCTRPTGNTAKPCPHEAAFTCVREGTVKAACDLTLPSRTACPRHDNVIVRMRETLSGAHSGRRGAKRAAPYVSAGHTRQSMPQVRHANVGRWVDGHGRLPPTTLERYTRALSGGRGPCLWNTWLRRLTRVPCFVVRGAAGAAVSSTPQETHQSPCAEPSFRLRERSTARRLLCPVLPALSLYTMLHP